MAPHSIVQAVFALLQHLALLLPLVHLFTLFLHSLRHLHEGCQSLLRRRGARDGVANLGLVAFCQHLLLHLRWHGNVVPLARRLLSERAEPRSLEETSGSLHLPPSSVRAWLAHGPRPWFRPPLSAVWLLLTLLCELQSQSSLEDGLTTLKLRGERFQRHDEGQAVLTVLEARKVVESLSSRAVVKWLAVQHEAQSFFFGTKLLHHRPFGSQLGHFQKCSSC
mmetsp:Transcript_64143/g.150355  ORF Transcript_64143/g.150355 Transcript_64143/m.150355 type:complete len:222 (-) Transcript_64143:379-1044(-)